MSQACLDWATSWVDRWAAREGDTPKEKVTKRVFTAFHLALCPSIATFVPARFRNSLLGMWSSVAFPVLLILLLLYLRVVRRASARFVAAASFTILAMIVTNDFTSSAEANLRPWPVAIVLVDVLLVVEANEAITVGIVAFMCVYLFVIQLEQHLRYGLYDLPGLAPYEDRVFAACCEKPPCPRGPAMSGSIFLANVMIFLLDFYFTRGFALQVRREKDKIAASVTAAEQVAERLASLDLDAAEAVLQGSEDVPPGLCESLYTILSHLRCYKPFLPQAVMLPAAFATMDDDESCEDLVRACSDVSPSSCSNSSVISKDIREASSFRLSAKGLSLLHLHPSLPVVDDAPFLASHSQVLEAVLKQAVSCKGVVDHFCGDVVSLSYNATAACVRHPMMAVQTAAALCLNKSHGACELRGAVVTGKAHVGVLGVPELRRHCIVGRLATVCRNIGEGAGILGHRLLCSHTTAVDVACVQPTRVLLDRFVFDTARHDDSYNGVAGVVHEVLACCVDRRVSKDIIDSEWMYELSQLSTNEWDAYNKAGCAFVCEGDAAAALDILHHHGVTEEKLALFNRVAAGARVLDFRTSVECVSLASVPSRLGP